MDAKFQYWRPEVKPHGTVEIGIEYYDDDRLRFVFSSVSIARYLELWNAKALKFQQKETPKPEHYPTPEQVRRYLENEAEAKAAREGREEPLFPPAPKTNRPPPTPAAEKPPPDLSSSFSSVLPMYQEAARALRGLGHEPTAEMLAKRLNFSVSRVKLFLELNPNFEGKIPESKAVLEKTHHKTRVPTDEKRKALDQASRALWEEGGKTPKWLRATRLIKKACELLGTGRLTEASLSGAFYTVFSAADREQWLDPDKRLGEKPPLQPKK